MEKANPVSRLFNDIWKFFNSLKLTVTVLLLLAATSVIGTLIPQNKNHADYFQEYGEFLYRIFYLFDFYDMYHSWWFQFLLVTMAVNIIVCSIDRLSATWKTAFDKSPKFNLGHFRKLPAKESFSSTRSVDELKAAFEKLAEKRFGTCRLNATENGFALFAEKWRWTRLGVYVVHFSILLLLLGAFLGSLLGFKGFANIAEGESVSEIRLTDTGLTRKLPFTIRCNDFDVSFYESGTPKEFRSSLTILENGEKVMDQDIIVNAPLRYKGINLFQASYGQLPPNASKLSFTDNVTGKTSELTVSMGKAVALPDGRGTFLLKTHTDDYHFKGREVGAALTGVLTLTGQKPQEIVVLLRFPSFDRMRKGEFFISALEHETRYYTGLQVTHDPGVLAVYAGFILMILGCYISFFMPHQKFCMEVTGAGGKTTVTVTGTANRNKLTMKDKVRKLSAQLEKL